MSFGNKRKIRQLYVIVLLFICSLIIAGCSSASKHSAGDFNESAANDRETGLMNSESKGEESTSSTAKRLAGENQTKPHFVIRTGTLELTVPNTLKAVKKIELMTADTGGIVGESRVYDLHKDQYAAELTLRIPEARFDSFIARLQDLGKTSNLCKSSEDRSLHYLDLEARIKNLRAEEKRLRAILTEAKTVEDLLKVERELFRIRGEIEAMTTEFTYLQDQVAFSTVQLYIKEKDIAGETISQKPFANIGSRLKEAFYRSINLIFSATALILTALAMLLPVFIIVSLITCAIVWAIRTSRRKKKKIPPGRQPPMVS